ncbi:MAG: anaerobic glycerol-3-phosphate dehydrogenase subunit C [Phycisphaerae bacterium]|nr:anaerobic glycerol-3-phosphate dehydrogenase subunit C [Phycisphaerae bacterium]
MKKTPERIAADLSKVVEGDVFADIVHRAAYSTDASIYRIVPACVVAPRVTADIVAVMKYARLEGVPVVARGAGSGLAGEALCRGIVFDMTRYMNRIVGIDKGGETVVCEPGLVLSDLNNHLEKYGRKIGPDPSSANRATVGGCVANNSTGAHWLEYGYMGEYVESIEAVLSDGAVVEFTNDVDPAEVEDKRVGSLAAQCAGLIEEKEGAISKALPKTKRNRCGYNIAGVYHDGRVDMSKLMAGSEGTLAVFTKITLGTVAVPAAKGLLQLEFESLAKMARAVPVVVESGVSACEMIDRNLIDMAIESLPEYRDILPAGAAGVLLVEHTGDSAEEVRKKIEVTDSAVGPAASGRSIVLDSTGQARIWKSRKDAGPLLYRKRSRKHPAEFMEDVSVDYHRLEKYLAGLEKIRKKYDISMSYFGHAGDGELHIRPNLDLGDPADLEKMRKVADEVFALAWSLGGTISGEHAVGLVRAAFVRRQYGEQYYDILCKVKKAFDPDDLMNPGKIINSDPDVMVKDLRAAQRIVPERIKTDLLFGEDELALELEQCYGCGLCRSTESDLRMCPVFRALGEELGSSRAKANLLGFWATGQLEDKDFESDEFRKFLDLCVNCRACTQQCPSGVDIPGLVNVARAEYVKRKGFRRAERRLSGNRHLGMLGSIFGPVANFFMGLGIFKWALEKSVGIDKRRAMPGFSMGSFLKAGRRYLASCERIAKPVDKVAYFVDTYANYNDHELGFAVVDVLRANGIEVILPKQLPAPLPAIVYGDVKRAKKDLAYSVRHLAGAVREGYEIVCSEPSAALCLKDELRRYVAGADAELVAENTFELMSYLLDLHEAGKLKPIEAESKERLLRRYAPLRHAQDGAGNDTAAKFVYHLPCHLSAIGQEGASIELLEGLCGVKVVDLKAGCCGLAGTYGMQKKNYELSSKIAQSLKTALESSATKNVLTECAACGMQIQHISDCTVKHPIKILAEAYGE